VDKVGAYKAGTAGNKNIFHLYYTSLISPADSADTGHSLSS